MFLLAFVSVSVFVFMFVVCVFVFEFVLFVFVFVICVICMLFLPLALAKKLTMQWASELRRVREKGKRLSVRLYLNFLSFCFWFGEKS